MKIRVKKLADIESPKAIEQGDWIDLRAAEAILIVKGEYCGDNDEWKIPAYAKRDTLIPKGERICQFRIVKHQPEIEFEIVDTLGNPDRGGYGSTGAM